MKSIRLKGIGKVEVVNTAAPIRNNGEALIRIQAVSICGSDIKAFKGQGTKVDYPIILGHEAAGEIVEIDADNPKGLQIGDRVILEPLLSCGRCYSCTIGRTNCCEELQVLGVHTDGCMSEFFVHPAGLLSRVPEDISLELVPLAEPLTIALHALHRVSLKKGEKVLVFGAGSIGLFVAMAALHYGGEPLLVDIVQERLEFAQSLGIRHVFNPKWQNVEDSIRKVTNGRMAETVVEASGSEICIKNTIQYASYCGRIIMLGWPNGESLLDTFLVIKKELEIYGSRNSNNEFAEALELIRNRDVDVRAIVSEIVSFDELPEMIERLAENPGKYIKIVSIL